MAEQPEALRLADRLDLYATGDKHQKDIEKAAAELRRLHAVNEHLLKALELVMADVKTTPNAYEAQRQAIAAAKEST